MAPKAQLNKKNSWLLHLIGEKVQPSTRVEVVILISAAVGSKKETRDFWCSEQGLRLDKPSLRSSGQHAIAFCAKLVQPYSDALAIEDVSIFATVKTVNSVMFIADEVTLSHLHFGLPIKPERKVKLWRQGKCYSRIETHQSIPH